MESRVWDESPQVLCELGWDYIWGHEGLTLLSLFQLMDDEEYKFRQVEELKECLLLELDWDYSEELGEQERVCRSVKVAA